MTKSRFIELLNLYLDNELTPREVGELMAEARAHPDRLALYREYCRIHRACSELELAAAAHEPPPAPFGLKQALYAASGVAAACVLLFLAARNAQPFFQDGEAGATVARLERTAPLFLPQQDQFEVMSASAALDIEPMLDSRPQFVSLGNLSLDRSLTTDLVGVYDTSERRRISPEQAKAVHAKLDAFFKEQRSKLQDVFGGVGNFETMVGASPAMRLDSNPAVFSFAKRTVSAQSGN